MATRSRGMLHSLTGPQRIRRGSRWAWMALTLALGSELVAARPSSAAICQTDTVPAATLLLPYFEVNLDDPNGLSTVFSVNNVSAAAVLAHVVIWSDLAVPVLDFNLYLTGNDVQTINLRDILVNGLIPATASAGQDPSDTISPKGTLSQDANFGSCQGLLPTPPLPNSLKEHLQAALTGRPSQVLQNLCAGQRLGDNVARGYITIDTVNNCTLRFPGDAGYFGPGGDVTDQNVLWGSWFIINASQNFAQGSDMVAIEADATNPATSTPGRYTFYGRYVGWSAADHREPLATTFAAQFLNGGPFTGGTDLLVWRDSKVAQQAFVCPTAVGLRPPWYPLPQEGLTIFDEQEHAVTQPLFPCSPALCPPTPAPFWAATQRVRVSGTGPSGNGVMQVPYSFGWLLLDLNGAVAAAGANPPFDPSAEQAWVVATESSNGHYAVALDTFRLDSACQANHLVP